ncbi:hypothetical protein CBR_g39745 [Chara braunii]|uniref:Uncharacterized protein n=1 Tax=Chara braunii TaxID=69332 RepID=A0A388LS57_CHABU|nr:hypothetical protein CBR_g39745 [Chara braunii]|eukprot:GBG85180.1 hypothetical protein CBR_g39745 [Chara braunii]
MYTQVWKRLASEEEVDRKRRRGNIPKVGTVNACPSSPTGGERRFLQSKRCRVNESDWPRFNSLLARRSSVPFLTTQVVSVVPNRHNQGARSVRCSQKTAGSGLPEVCCGVALQSDGDCCRDGMKQASCCDDPLVLCGADVEKVRGEIWSVNGAGLGEVQRLSSGNVGKTFERRGGVVQRLSSAGKACESRGGVVCVNDTDLGERQGVYRVSSTSDGDLGERVGVPSVSGCNLNERPEVQSVSGAGFRERPQVRSVSSVGFVQRPKVPIGSWAGVEERPEVPRFSGAGLEARPEVQSVNGGSSERLQVHSVSRAGLIERPGVPIVSDAGLEERPEVPSVSDAGLELRPEAVPSFSSAAGSNEKLQVQSVTRAGLHEGPEVPFVSGAGLEEGPEVPSVSCAGLEERPEVPSVSDAGLGTRDQVSNVDREGPAKQQRDLSGRISADVQDREVLSSNRGDSKERAVPPTPVELADLGPRGVVKPEEDGLNGSLLAKERIGREGREVDGRNLHLSSPCHQDDGAAYARIPSANDGALPPDKVVAERISGCLTAESGPPCNKYPSFPHRQTVLGFHEEIGGGANDIAGSLSRSVGETYGTPPVLLCCNLLPSMGSEDNVSSGELLRPLSTPPVFSSDNFQENDGIVGDDEESIGGWKADPPASYDEYAYWRR